MTKSLSIVWIVSSSIAYLAVCARAWTGGSFHPRNAFTNLSKSSFGSPPSNHEGGGGMSMYFDDVSRYGVQWQPASSNISPQRNQQEQAQQQQQPQQNEQDMVQRILTGYDADTASQLSSLDIQRQTKLWTEKSGVVGDFFGDELYTDLLSIRVARSAAPSMVHSLADFWQSVADVIHLHTDKDLWPPRWTSHARYHNLNLTATTAFATAHPASSSNDRKKGDRVHMIVMPDCHDLYDYSTFTTLLAAVEFSKELCVHLGRHFSLTAFHPHFKNSPKLFSPERHAPFPTVGLQLLRPSELLGQDADLPLGGRAVQRPLEQSKTTDNGKILPHPEKTPEDEEIGALADARIRNLDQTRAHFEVLFNSAAATDQKDVIPRSFPSSASEQAAARNPTTSATAAAAAVPDYPDTSMSEEEQLAMTFRHERQRRRGDLPSAMVRQVIALWMDEQRYADSSKRQLNPALEFMDTIDGYTVCTQKMGELVYADIWQTIRQVYDKGLAADTTAAQEGQQKKQGDGPGRATTASKSNKNRFNLSQWMHSLSNDHSAGETNQQKQHGTHDELPQVVSTLFIATKFNTYNAQSFKRFAITINAALKRITGGRMFLEVFHPEYVGNQGYHHALRRSPFPMIQICYLVSPQEDTSNELQA